MSIRRLAVLVAAALAAAGAVTAAALQPERTRREPRSPAAATTDHGLAAPSSSDALVRRYGVFERTFTWDSSAYANPWEAVDLELQLTSPTGRHYRVGGFYYATNTWRARFSPSETGRWSWRAQMSDGRRRSSFQGSFRVVAGTSPGPVRPRPGNRFLWSFADGSPYYPLGVDTCVLDVEHTGSPLNSFGFDGGFRPPGVHLPGSFVGIDTYLRAYSSAGVNLFRWSAGNCAFPLYQTIAPGGNVYGQKEGIWGDELVQALRRHGMRVFMTFFDQPPYGANPSRAELAAVERYVRYVVDRYGGYVDYWELMNESNVSDSWYRQVGTYLHRIDPYRHPVSTSNERPDLSVIDINSPHWYESESEFDSDSDTWQRIAGWKRAGKPVIVGEQGNTGQNWDPTSALRMRLRAWTAFFAEGTLIFWDATFAKDYRNAGAADLYIGPQERGYLRVLSRFTAGFDPHATIARVGVSDPRHVRGYALRGPREYAAYLHAFTNHRSATVGVRITIDAPVNGLATWSSPATGAVLARERVSTARRVLAAPPFTTDVALKLR